MKLIDLISKLANAITVSRQIRLVYVFS